METQSISDNNYRVLVSALLYWVLLISFVLSYILSQNSISLVLVADRIIDAVGMSIALGSQRIVEKPPTAQFTYGFHRFESLSSTGMIVAFILLLVYSGLVSYGHSGSTVSSDQFPTLYASILSLFTLPIISYLLRGNKNITTETMNIHTLQDIITSALALVSSIILLFIQSGFLEFLFSVIIIFGSVLLNRDLVYRNLRLLMEGTELNSIEIEKALKDSFPMVHHLHIWDVCRHYRLATVHVYADGGSRLDELDVIRNKISEYLYGQGINHLTIQFETSPLSS